MIISLLNQKGGVGKTTLSIHIAAQLSLLGYKVLFIDADVQGSAQDWAAARKGERLFNVVSITKPIIHKELINQKSGVSQPLSKGYDFVIIDCPPRVYDVAKSAIVASNLILLPVQPSPYDIWSAQETVDLIKEMENIIHVESAFIINRKISNSAIARDLEEQLEVYKTPVLESHICQRVSYAESATTGSTVMEDKRDPLAIDEIVKLTDEILETYYNK